jgi:hypothetical protein
VSAIRSERPDEIETAVAALSNVEVFELLAELCACVDDVTDGKDVDKLVAAATLPLPNDSAVLVAAVNLKSPNDLRALHAYADGDLVKLIASMLAVIASLQEAGERI